MLVILAVFLVSLITGVLVLEKLISMVKGLKFSGIVDLGLMVPDLHKKGRPLVPKIGGVGVYFALAMGVLAAVAYFTFLGGNKTSMLLAMLTSVSLIAFMAFVDDLLKISNKMKALIPALGAVPLIAVKAGTTVMTVPLLGTVDFGAFYYILVILGVLGASNATNMLAGYNGISSGAGIITMTGLLAIALHTGNLHAALLLAAGIGSFLAFWYYNFYPARCLPGMADFLVGAVIANAVIIGNMEKAGLLMFPLYFLELGLKARKKFKNTWWSRLRKDGRLEPASNIIETFPHLLMRIHGPLTERRIVLDTYAIQALIVLAVVAYAW